MPPTNGRNPHWDIYEQHLEATEFLWNQWEQALVAPDYVIEDVTQLEGRLHLHVDGLVLGGELIAKRLLLPGLESDDPERIRTAAFVLLLSGIPGSVNAVLERVRAADDVARSALQRALEVQDPARLPSWLQRFPREEDPILQVFGLDVLGYHHRAPPEACQALASHTSSKIATAAVRAAGRSRVALTPAVLERALAASSVELRDAAIETALLGGHRSASASCRAIIRSRAPGSPLPMLVLAMMGDERDLEEVQSLLSNEAFWPDVLWALGFSGRIPCANTCLEFMRQDTVAALAGEAFSAITGLRIVDSYATEPPRSKGKEPVPFEQEDLDENLVPRPEDMLPLPQVDAITSWWQQTRPRLDSRRRYLDGRLFSSQALIDALSFSSMRRRHVLALELAMRTRGAHQLPTRAFMEQQLRAMRQVSAVPASVRSQNFG